MNFVRDFFFLITKRKAIFLMLLCTIFISLGQILWKLGAVKINLENILTIFNLPLFFGFISYGFGALLMLLAFREGELSILYPIVATSYVWISLFSPLIFSADSMNVWKWLGVIIIIFSIFLLGINNSSNVKVSNIKTLKVKMKRGG